MDENVAVLKYIIRFGLVYLVLLFGIGVVQTLLDIDAGMGVSIVALMAAAAMAASTFVRDHQRAPNVSERAKLVWVSFLVSWLVSLVLTGVLATSSVAGSELLQVFSASNIAIVAGVIVVVSVLYLGVLSLAYGYLARKQVEAIDGSVSSQPGKSPQQYKKLMLLVVLLLPLLYFVHPTNEYTFINRLLTSFRTYHPAEIDIDALSPSLSISDIVAGYPGLDLYCAREETSLASESCYNHVTSINGSEAWSVAFFFKKKHLIQVKMDFLEPGHDEFLTRLKSRHGEPLKIENSSQKIPLVMWNLREGVLVTNSSSYPGKTTQVLWLSGLEIIDQLKRGHSKEQAH